MKKSNLTLATAALAFLFIGTTAFANTTSVKNTPNYENWDYGNDPWEEVLNMEEIPEIATPVYINKLEVDAMATKDNFLIIDLPYEDNEIIGLVIYDKKGTTVFNQKEEYRALKTVLISDTGDNEYVVKAYKGNTIHEARMKVVHK